MFGTTSRSNVIEELQRLSDLGMVERDRREDDRRVYYVRSTSPLWEIVELAAETIGLRWDDGRVDLGVLD